MAFLTICRRQLCVHAQSKYFSAVHGTVHDQTSDLMKSVRARKAESVPSKTSKELRQKHCIELPVLTPRKRGLRAQKRGESVDVLQGKSKLLNKLNQESDVYILGNTPFINRKYEPLVEQIEHINRPLDALDAAEHTAVYDSASVHDMEAMEGSEDEMNRPSKIQKKPNKLHVEQSLSYIFGNFCVISVLCMLYAGTMEILLQRRRPSVVQRGGNMERDSSRKQEIFVRQIPEIFGPVL